MDFIALPLQAALWGGLAGSALLLGATIGYFVNLPHRVVSGVMAFGTGVLISALSFDLMDEAVTKGGVLAAAIGFTIGVILYSSANAILDRYGAKHRKRSRKSSTVKAASGGTAIALGALIDGIPESAAIGVSLLDGEGVALVAPFLFLMYRRVYRVRQE
jgi:ZIP family zinc transporter